MSSISWNGEKLKFELKRLYLIERLCVREIAEKFGKPINTIYNRMNEFNISRRALSEAQRIPILGLKGEGEIKSKINNLYWKKNLSVSTVGEKLGVSMGVIYRWMIKFGIPRRTLSESHKGQHCSAENGFKKGQTMGNKNFNWKGGISYHYGKNWIKIGELVRIAFHNTCAFCGINNQMCKVLYRANLDIHHLDGSKNNHFFKNLICLCRKCHMRLEELQHAR